MKNTKQPPQVEIYEVVVNGHKSVLLATNINAALRLLFVEEGVESAKDLPNFDICAVQRGPAIRLPGTLQDIKTHPALVEAAQTLAHEMQGRTGEAEGKVGRRDEKIEAAENLAREAREMASMIKSRCGSVADGFLEALTVYERTAKP